MEAARINKNSFLSPSRHTGIYYVTAVAVYFKVAMMCLEMELEPESEPKIGTQVEPEPK